MASAQPPAAGEDPRFVRSRRAITDALASLLQQMGTYPSVAAVAQAAGVHRATFYNHFQSVEEVAVALIAEDFPATLDGMLEAVRQRRNVFLVASAWRSPSGLMGISDLLADHVRELRRTLGRDADDVEDVYTACGMNGVLSAAVSGGLGDRPDEITARLHAVLPGWMRPQPTTGG